MSTTSRNAAMGHGDQCCFHRESDAKEAKQMGLSQSRGRTKMMPKRKPNRWTLDLIYFATSFFGVCGFGPSKLGGASLPKFTTETLLWLGQVSRFKTQSQRYSWVKELPYMVSSKVNPLFQQASGQADPPKEKCADMVSFHDCWTQGSVLNMDVRRTWRIYSAGPENELFRGAVHSSLFGR